MLLLSQHILLLLLFFPSLEALFGDDMSRCEPLQHLQPGICNNTVYNMTVRPNRFGHHLQAESYQELLQYKPLFNVNCSPHFQQFICTLYLPPCVNDPTNVGEVTLMQPCFELCESARKNCEQLLLSFGVSWPKPLDCANLPREKPGKLLSGVSSQEVPTLCIPAIPIPDSHSGINSSFTGRQENQCPDPSMAAKPGLDYQVTEPSNTRHEEIYHTNCGLTCESVRRLYTTKSQINILRLSSLTIALLTLITTSFTLVTFFMDVRRFRYPERPIIYMSLCYLIVSIVHVTSFSLGDHTVACTSFDVSDTSAAKFISGENRVVTQGTLNNGCTVVFSLVYFFTMAASIWWVLLAFAWFLAAGLKWGHEAIEGIAHFFHVVAWAVPLIAAIVVLALGIIEGDPVTGLCRIAVFSSPIAPSLTRALHVTPQLICLCIGGFLLLAGFASLFRIRTVMKADGARTDRLERLMARIGILGLLFTIPSVVSVAASLFLLANKDAYLNIYFDRKCYSQSADANICFSPESDNDYALRPDFTVIMLEHICAASIGLSMAFWVWSRKTMSAWGRCLCCACCSSNESEAPLAAATTPMSPSNVGMPGAMSAPFAGSSSTAGAPLLPPQARFQPGGGAGAMSQMGQGMPNMGMGMYNGQQPLIGNMAPNLYLSS